MIHQSGIKTATKHKFPPKKTGRNPKNSYSLPEAARGLNELELTLYVKEFVMYYYLVPSPNLADRREAPVMRRCRAEKFHQFTVMFKDQVCKSVRSGAWGDPSK